MSRPPRPSLRLTCARGRCRRTSPTPSSAFGFCRAIKRCSSSSAFRCFRALLRIRTRRSYLSQSQRCNITTAFTYQNQRFSTGALHARRRRLPCHVHAHHLPSVCFCNSLSMCGEAFKEFVEDCEQFLATPAAARYTRSSMTCLHPSVLHRLTSRAACGSRCGT